MNKTEEIKAAIVEYVRENRGTSYAELERIFERLNFNYKGDLLACSDVNPYVVFWEGWNIEALRIVSDLLVSGELEREPCEPLVYLVDGKTLILPIAKTYTNYKTEHWLPCVFNIPEVKNK